MYNEIVRNFYEVLRVRTNASQEQIKKAYMELVRKYHPDVYHGDKFYAERFTAIITEAYSVLKDPARREEYNLLHNISSNPTKRQLRQEDSHIKREKKFEKKMPRRNYEQEMSMRYFKNSERKRPARKKFLRKIIFSKFFLCLLFILGLQVAIILLIYTQSN